MKFIYDYFLWTYEVVEIYFFNSKQNQENDNMNEYMKLWIIYCIIDSFHSKKTKKSWSRPDPDFTNPLREGKVQDTSSKGRGGKGKDTSPKGREGTRYIPKGKGRDKIGKVIGIKSVDIIELILLIR